MLWWGYITIKYSVNRYRYCWTQCFLHISGFGQARWDDHGRICHQACYCKCRWLCGQLVSTWWASSLWSYKWVSNLISLFFRMLVWPQRLLIPLLYDADSLAKTAKMMYRHQGLVKVEVLQVRAPPIMTQLSEDTRDKSAPTSISLPPWSIFLPRSCFPAAIMLSGREFDGTWFSIAARQLGLKKVPLPICRAHYGQVKLPQKSMPQDIIRQSHVHIVIFSLPQQIHSWDKSN